ncbi:MAG: N-acetylmuramoyl-L-alanine amidase [Verrucomicrobiales bacterium]|jgi:N-acetylmuramoyl-L-alanine amidase
MTNREKAPGILILVGLMTALPLTCLMWWWASNRHDETMDLRDNISVLAPTPEWGDLDAYQKTITREAFAKVLEDTYSEGPAWKTSIKINDDHAIIRAPDQPYRLDFASSPSSDPPKRYWRSAAEMPIGADEVEILPLKGIKIAIDPGHIGGDWAKMEERWYQIDGEGTEVKEGELTLKVAQLLEPELEALGAKVTLVRTKNEPVTKHRPEDFIELATKELAMESPTPEAIEARSKIMFYRWSEIRARAKKINKLIKPDLTLCLHFNAESWGDPAQPQLVNRNHLHLLINGTYSNHEFSLHDQRLDLMKRLLQRVHPEELKLSSAVADSMADATRLPAYVYTKPTAQRVSDNPFIYARNLMANRIYYCPTVFLEPYVMNSEEVYERIGAGDYEGQKEVSGKLRKSIFREYADGVIDGLVDYYRDARPKKS